LLIFSTSLALFASGFINQLIAAAGMGNCWGKADQADRSPLNVSADSWLSLVHADLNRESLSHLIVEWVTADWSKQVSRSQCYGRSCRKEETSIWVTG
jgi:hypothetical protein